MNTEKNKKYISLEECWCNLCFIEKLHHLKYDPNEPAFQDFLL